MTNKEIVVREATEFDVREIVELSYGLFQEDAGQRDPFMNLNWPKEEGEVHYSRLVTGEHSLCLLAEIDGEIIAYLAGYTYDKTSLRPVKLAELESMCVKKEFRGLGVGTRLVTRFLEWSRQEGAERVSVTAYVTNDKAVNFYKSFGFTPRNLTLEREA